MKNVTMPNLVALATTAGFSDNGYEKFVCAWGNVALSQMSKSKNGPQYTAYP